MILMDIPFDRAVTSYCIRAARVNRLWSPVGERIVHAHVRLGFSNRQTTADLVFPQALDVGNHRDDFFVAELSSERGHGALEVGQENRVFLYLSTLLDDSVQVAVRVVPCVTIAVERRGGHGAVGIGDVPVRLPLPLRSVASRADRGEDLLSRPHRGRRIWDLRWRRSALLRR